MLCCVKRAYKYIYIEQPEGKFNWRYSSSFIATSFHSSGVTLNKSKYFLQLKHLITFFFFSRLEVYLLRRRNKGCESAAIMQPFLRCAPYKKIVTPGFL